MTGDGGTRRIGDRYRLGEHLGRGGMGVVWAATDERLGRVVAVKEVIPPVGLTAEQADQTRARSLREARAAARINSRSAVSVYDVVEQDGRLWIVMELLDARPLSQIITEDGPLPPAAVADIASQLLAALATAHANGVLHRDVKPSNVMIDADGRVVLTDFGIAALDGDPSVTTTGVLIGSPAYIAPERAQGYPASPASDLWSLGCTMFTALEGRPPFDREGSMATLSAVLSDDPLPAPSAGPLTSTLEGLLRKDPTQRLSAEDTDRSLRLAKNALARPATTPLPTQPRPLRPAPAGGTVAVLPVVPPEQLVPLDRNAPPEQAALRTSIPVAAGRSRRRASTRLVAALAAVLLGLGAIVAGVILTRDGVGDGGQAASSDGQSVAPDGPSTGATTTEARTSSDPTITSGPAEGSGDALPEGFEPYTDETGFSVALPAGWDVSKEGSRTDFTEPGTGRFLRVDQTQDPQPDPVADWENQEASVSQRLPGYELIRIDPVDYRDYDAADWEFTWVPEDGPPLHVLNRNLITGPDRAYALYWNTPEGQWEDSLTLFDTITQTFVPAP